MEAPKAFISYSWSNDEHQKWVLDLATELRESGVNVILDKWDLREGQDAIAFMEQMVSDDSIKKVIVVFDRVYAARADGRSGGVGTETQIMTPQIYKNVDQNKFVGVISERGEDGKPFLPTFYSSRIFIDLSSDEIRTTNFEQLVRWVFDRPTYPKPPLGRRPEYLDEEQALLPTRAKANRAIDALKRGDRTSTAALQDYYDAFADGFETFRVKPQDNAPIHELVIKSIASFQPYRDEYIAVVTALARSDLDERKTTLTHRFIEKLIPFMFAPANFSSWIDQWADNYRLIVHELFLYTIAILIKNERFQNVGEMLSSTFYVGGIDEFRTESSQPFNVLRQPVSSLEQRNTNLKLGRASLQADFIRDGAGVSGISLEDLMQADLVLLWHDATDAVHANRRVRWFPFSLIWSERQFRPFEIFARSISTNYFLKLCPALGVTNVADFKDIYSKLGRNLGVHQVGFWQLDSEPLIEPEKLCTRP